MIATMPRLIKPWSISTTARNPDRLRGFLGVLAPMDGKNWDASSQIDFQIRLVQARLYGAFNRQFYNGLSRANIYLLESMQPISYRQAAAIFKQKHYKDLSRGCRSFKPLQRFGFANIIDGKVSITETGKAFLVEEFDYDEIYTHALLKWQLPNPLDLRRFPSSQGYNIKPFVGTLRLIDEVDRLCRKKGMKEKGLTYREVGIFATTLIDARHVESTAKDVVCRRLSLDRSDEAIFDAEEARKWRPNFNFNNMDDHLDGILGAFMITKMIACYDIYRSGIYVPLTRKIEADAIIQHDDASAGIFASASDYVADLGKIDSLPWENTRSLADIIVVLKNSIVDLGGKMPVLTIAKYGSVDEMKKHIAVLRKERLELMAQRDMQALKSPSNIREIARQLRMLQP